MDDGKRRIAGWAWMLVGVGVVAYSAFIESRTEKNLAFFFWIGIAFVVWGALQEFIPRLKARPRRKELVGPPSTHNDPEHTSHLHPAGRQHHGVSPLATHQHTQPATHPSHPYTPLHKQCPRCHQVTHGKSRFCHLCGHQFF
ncbi:TPA: hypothetical protein HA251_03100 [Candidatus Woesearchaeota archaeon]|nr:hypothetical protein [Candidatus Woesearchaeota archaeon]